MEPNQASQTEIQVEQVENFTQENGSGINPIVLGVITFLLLFILGFTAIWAQTLNSIEVEILFGPIYILLQIPIKILIPLVIAFSFIVTGLRTFLKKRLSKKTYRRISIAFFLFLTLTYIGFAILFMFAMAANSAS